MAFLYRSAHRAALTDGQRQAILRDPHTAPAAGSCHGTAFTNITAGHVDDRMAGERSLPWRHRKPILRG